ncbi:MAG: MFS transporter [Gammaproteobacteria bacterium]|nr:MAG: MFS transporter [Gammaproteobacteria bacterium]
MTGHTEPQRERRHVLAILVLVFASSHVDRQIMGILGQPIKESLALSDTQLGLMTGLMFALFYATLGMPIAMWQIAATVETSSLYRFTLECGHGHLWRCCKLRPVIGRQDIRRCWGSRFQSAVPFDHCRPLRAGSSHHCHGNIRHGVNFGILIGFLLGGWVNEWIGWRWAFVIAGLPGLLLGLIVRFTVREPIRGQSDPGTVVRHAPRFPVVIRTMTKKPVVLHFVLGSALASFVGYAVVLWIPVYFVRIHDVGTGLVGTWLALLIGGGGALGTFLGGYFADRLSTRHGPSWRSWIIALAIIIALPFSLVTYFSDSPFQGFIAFVIPSILGGVYIGPTFAMVQSQMPIEMRSVAASINLFVGNIIGLGLGPYAVGAISDALQPIYGGNSLRYALSALAIISVWSALHFFLGGRCIRDGLPPTSPGRISNPRAIE